MRTSGGRERALPPDRLIEQDAVVMNFRIRRRGAILFPVCLAFMAALGCDVQVSANLDRAQATDSKTTTGATGDTAIEPHRIELLELAHAAATSIPIQPHIKDRCKMQALVVTTCIELDQLQRAVRYADTIEDWRRGEGYASYALACAKIGRSEEAELYISRAEEIAATASDWRRDTISSLIAQTLLWLGQPKRAAAYDTGLSEVVAGKSHEARAETIDPALFPAQVEAIDALVATGVFEHVRNGLDVFTILHDRFYADQEKRELLEARIRSNWTLLPHLIRIDLLAALVDASLKHGDSENAAALVRDIEVMVGELNWRAEYRVPILAKLAALQYRTGSVEGAANTARESMRVFEQGRETIGMVFRAGSLRPLAEAYVAMSDHGAALRVYARVVEEGAENVNARPRAEDLCATLCSLAKHNVKPDPDLWARMREIVANLGNAP